MLNIILTGVGGQGTVLASKVLAMAAAAKGWHVRTAETIGMAQRGGSVTSHVRMGNLGEEVYAPLVTHGTANLIIAFEPGEAARQLDYLSPEGAVVTAMSTVDPVTATLASEPYSAEEVIDNIQRSFYNEYARTIAENNGMVPRGGRRQIFTVDDREITDLLDGNRKVLNSILLAAAVQMGCLPLTMEDLRSAITVCVKRQFIEMNVSAIETTSRYLTLG